ncbi:hypothetical protein EDD18DRAFT_1423355 [Armillaria luteobubalina]|uniref:Peptidase C14 caspase domain-containing protein n=1 Tax=Armillaria luteobubalina TaxID=153913 RepID=A0AA39PRB3_9AGAR|nr:hypothetical protein EDD18DRAFT_1423355 [Armillaria luteobubalina]
MSRGNVDSVTVFLATRQRALHSADHRQDLTSLNKLRILRQKRSRAQKFSPWKVTRPPLQLGTPHRCDGSRFWVVLIGIEKYNGRPLHGCVSDARLMEKYFVEELRVPKDRIQLLLGSEDHTSPDDPMYPSRTHITDVLRGLATNDKIEHGENIIVYFAGHGSCYSYYEDDGDEDGICENIEALCPIDRDTLGANDKCVPDDTHGTNDSKQSRYRARKRQIYQYRLERDMTLQNLLKLGVMESLCGLYNQISHRYAAKWVTSDIKLELRK